MFTANPNTTLNCYDIPMTNVATRFTRNQPVKTLAKIMSFYTLTINTMADGSMTNNQKT